MKIGILTIHNSPNYGACLQCFALWKFLSDCGHDVEVIDLYRPFAFEGYIPSKSYKSMRSAETSFLSSIKKRFKSCFGLDRKEFVSLYNEKARIKFDSFNSEIKFSNPFKSIEELYSTPLNYDAVIAGSDQLWNPTQAYCLEPFFLTFVDRSQCKKLSYATSIGISELFESEKKLFKKWLEDFTSISVREKRAQALLSSFVNKEIEQVADPTFLLSLDYWKTFVHKPVASNYILLFNLTHQQDLIQYALSISMQSGKRLVVLGQKEHVAENEEYQVVDDAGPKEWMGYIANADLVLTNSFHCTVFSILLGTKNFYSYIAPGNKRGSRIIELLSLFKLDSHLLKTSLNQRYADLVRNEVDRDTIIKIYQAEQMRSREYLIKNLK